MNINPSFTVPDNIDAVIFIITDGPIIHLNTCGIRVKGIEGLVIIKCIKMI